MKHHVQCVICGKKDFIPVGWIDPGLPQAGPVAPSALMASELYLGGVALFMFNCAWAKMLVELKLNNNALITAETYLGIRMIGTQTTWIL